ncbi:MAG TPA: BamA/TamA family outer membrane protein [Steroidobacteraceae bacterium]|nr:BamA/TamA family outer membrane protein [Steroidobacteraceae bacterium]
MKTHSRGEGVHKRGHLYSRLLRAGLVLLALQPLLAFALDDAPGAPDALPIVEGIDCVGNTTMSCETIRDKLGIAVGREMDESQIALARLRLQTLPNIKAADIHLIKGSQRLRVIVVVAVTETDPITTAFSTGTLAEIARQGTRMQTIAGRITDHDLLGTGKTLDLTIVGAVPLPGSGSGQEYAARLQYFDPAVFGSRRFFFMAGAFYSRSSLDLPYSPYGAFTYSTYQQAGIGLDFSLGLHLDSHSYVTLGYRYLLNTGSGGSEGAQWLTSDGMITTLSTAPGGAFLFTIGRNTEDDPSFPTRGWLLHAYDQWHTKALFSVPSFSGNTAGGNFAGILARATWRAGPESFWTFQARPFDDFQTVFDDDLGFSIVYSHTLFEDGTERRSRWYVGPGFSNIRHPEDFPGGHYFEVGVKAGLRFETKYLGTVNLYVIAAHPFQRGY